MAGASVPTDSLVVVSSLGDSSELEITNLSAPSFSSSSSSSSLLDLATCGL
eukprot:CAMPEP_0184306062 /NCGR_PEP_ID=MMETSP1049-20130417/15161_1 /TAXON_ID=77928 /ORGANISM="Proteomonas sulcata, Strain CCMP704" /LENGTH=50 /DNA_ID=CAMNT_0026618245 /DNA_START=158 /DNA_END=310 /DNA_ORIENTATION=+